MDKIAIFTGAFNPPHAGHASVIEALSTNQTLKLSQIWLMPDVFDDDKRVSVSVEMRIDMLKLMLEEKFSQSPIPIKISDFLLKQSHQISMYQIKADLQKSQPNAELLFVISSDSLPNISRWTDGNKLLVTSNFILISRSKKPYPNLPSNILLLANLKKVGITSTQIRYKLRAKQDTKDLLTKKVLEYIQTHGLYQF